MRKASVRGKRCLDTEARLGTALGSRTNCLRVGRKRQRTSLESLRITSDSAKGAKRPGLDMRARPNTECNGNHIDPGLSRPIRATDQRSDPLYRTSR